MNSFALEGEASIAQPRGIQLRTMAQVQDLTLLRRKLSLLSYPEHLDDSSASLVQRLVDDLIHTTESYRNLKTQLDARGQDLSEYYAKVCLCLAHTLMSRCSALSVNSGAAALNSPLGIPILLHTLKKQHCSSLLGTSGRVRHQTVVCTRSSMSSPRTIINSELRPQRCTTTFCRARSSEKRMLCNMRAS